MIKSLPLLPLQEIIGLRKGSDYASKGKAFLGSPRRHPSDESRIVLVTKVLENQRVFLEFKKVDILHVDEAKTVSSIEGETISLLTLWVRRGSVGIELKPFRIED